MKYTRADIVSLVVTTILVAMFLRGVRDDDLNPTGKPCQTAFASSNTRLPLDPEASKCGFRMVAQANSFIGMTFPTAGLGRGCWIVKLRGRKRRRLQRPRGSVPESWPDARRDRTTCAGHTTTGPPRNGLFRLRALLGRIERHAARSENHTRRNAIVRQPSPDAGLLRGWEIASRVAPFERLIMHPVFQAHRGDTLRVQDCLEQSEECLRLRKLAGSEAEARLLGELSNSWKRLAGQIDRYRTLIRKQGASS